MLKIMVVLLMANGITFPPAEPDKERYTPEQLYTYLVFADNYVKSKNISDDEFDPKNTSPDILNVDDPDDMEVLVAFALAEHSDAGFSTGYSQNRISPPNKNGSRDYGLWQINDFWTKRLSLRFPELFDNGRPFVENISNPYANAVAAIYIGGYVEGDGPNGRKNWSTDGMVKPDSDFIMDAQAGIAKQEKTGGDLMKLKDFKYPNISNKILDKAYGEPVRQTMQKESQNIQDDAANFFETTDIYLRSLLDRIKPTNPNAGRDKMKLRQQIGDI